ncbi:TPA: hypothetical protein DDW35_01395 [Candidatus Sumerlaeota bacterium]|nr:hypothetical protein [Candidatus Sumerlaeota bacterium]
MPNHSEKSSAPPADHALQWLRFHHDKRGAIMLEYVILLLVILLPLSSVIVPWVKAIKWFMANVYFQVCMP